MSKLSDSIEIVSVGDLEIDYDTVREDYKLDDVAVATAYFDVVLKYLPTNETWKERYTVTLSGSISGGYYYPASSYNRWGDPGDPAEGGWDHVTFDEVEGTIDFVDVISEEFPEALLDVDLWDDDDFLKKLMDTLEKAVWDQLPFDDCEDWG